MLDWLVHTTTSYVKLSLLLVIISVLIRRVDIWIFVEIYDKLLWPLGARWLLCWSFISLRCALHTPLLSILFPSLRLVPLLLLLFYTLQILFDHFLYKLLLGWPFLIILLWICCLIDFIIAFNLTLFCYLLLTGPFISIVVRSFVGVQITVRSVSKVHSLC